MKVNEPTYRKLIDEDLAWLMRQPRTLERDHIALVLSDTVRFYYPDGDAAAAHRSRAASAAGKEG